MNSRRLFSKMAQIVILIVLIVLAFFLIRGFARGDHHEEKMVFRSEGGTLPFMERWKEICGSPPHAENMSNVNHELVRDIKIRYNTNAFHSNLNI